jgi:uncharacterized damage-inducible protein DinB
MAPADLPIAPFYAGWGIYQQKLVTAITPLTAEHLELRVAPHQWSVSILLRHIIGARVGWFHEWMGEGTENDALRKYAGWDDDMDAHPSASELVQGMEATWQMIDTALQRWTTADMAQLFQSPWNPARPQRTRQYIIWHVLEHDIHHGGEVSLILGAHGLAPIDL